MGPWGRIFPRRISGRSGGIPGPPNCGFWALSGGTWLDPRLGTPRRPSGRIFAPRPQGGSGRPARAPGGRIRPESTCFPVAPGRLRGPEIPHSGPAPGAPGAAGPERAPRVAPQEARSPRQPEGPASRRGKPAACAPSGAARGTEPRQPQGRASRRGKPPACLRAKAQLDFAAWGCPSRAHVRQGLRNGCPEERAARAGNHPDRWANQVRAQEVQRSEAETVRGAERCGRDQGLRG